MTGIAHRYGEPAWVDLTTTDAARALAFYQAMFGWQGETEPAGGGAQYTTCLLDGEPVAGITPDVPEADALGWTTYFAVADIEASALRAEQLGGRTRSVIRNYRDAGRAVAVEDPQGAVFGLFQAGPRPGLGVLNRPGSLCWTELDTPDVQGAREFYCGLFDYEVRDTDSATGGRYMILSVDGAPVAGVVALEAEWPTVLPARWLSYFAVADLEAATSRLIELGGTRALGPVISSYAEFNIVRDPFRDVFCLSRVTEPLRRDPQPADGSR